MPNWILFFLCLVGVVFALKLLYLVSTGWALPITQGALFTPTPSKRIETFLDAVPMNSKDLFVDLGCGDGRVLRAARKRYGVTALGLEVNPLAYAMAKIRNIGLKGIHIKWKNFWGQDLSHADVVFCYLFPDVMEGIADKMHAELHPGSQVVSCNFPLPGWDPLEVLRPDSDRHQDPIYIYRLPESCRSFGTGKGQHPKTLQ